MTTDPTPDAAPAPGDDVLTPDQQLMSHLTAGVVFDALRLATADVLGRTKAAAVPLWAGLVADADVSTSPTVPVSLQGIGHVADAVLSVPKPKATVEDPAAFLEEQRRDHPNEVECVLEIVISPGFGADGIVEAIREQIESTYPDRSKVYVRGGRWRVRDVWRDAVLRNARGAVGEVPADKNGTLLKGLRMQPAEAPSTFTVKRWADGAIAQILRRVLQPEALGTATAPEPVTAARVVDAEEAA